MPPARRSSGPAAKGSQKTLSFSNSKVTKSTTTPLGKELKNSPLSKSITKIDPATVKRSPSVDLKIKDEDNNDSDVLGHVSSAAAVAQQAKVELAKEKTEDEVRAEKVTDVQIRKYWRERESERRTKRVHQEDVGVEEKILRLFDISSQFGVSWNFSLLLVFILYPSPLFYLCLGINRKGANVKNSHA
jgi:DNA polymerase delta subunit 4